MKIKKVLISIAILIVLMPIIMFLIKFSRINIFLNKVHKNFEISNFQFDSVRLDENNNIIGTYKYLKNNSTLLIIPNENVKVYSMDRDGTTLGLVIDEKNKIFYKNEVTYDKSFSLSGELKKDYSILEKIKLCFKWNLKNEEIDGIKCIVITDEDNITTYYDEKNAYLLGKIGEFKIDNININTVTENDVAVPNLEGYTKK